MRSTLKESSAPTSGATRSSAHAAAARPPRLADVEVGLMLPCNVIITDG
jgi:hypothetical protein